MLNCSQLTKILRTEIAWQTDRKSAETKMHL